MPVYNAEPYLQKAAQSICAQTFADFEFLIFDDGSHDRSSEVLSLLARRDKRIVLGGGTHYGYTHWLNEGLHLARGEFIARMDADDIARPDRLASQVDYLDRHNDCVAVGCRAVLIDSHDLPFGFWDVPLGHDDIDDRHARGEAGQLIHPSVMMRADVLRAIGGYRRAFETAEDFDLWLRLAEVGRLANLREHLLWYREHAGSVSFSRSLEQTHIVRRIVAEARARRGLPPADLSAIDVGLRTHADQFRRWIWLATTAGYSAQARKYALHLLRVDWRNIATWRLVLGTLLRTPRGHGRRSLVRTREASGSNRSGSVKH